MLRNVLLVSFSAGGLLAGMAACSSGGSAVGGSTPSPTTLLRDARSAFDSASSVKISGVVAHNGSQITVNLAMFRSGDTKGTVRLGATQVALTIVHGRAYEYVSKKSFSEISQSQKIPASACAVMCGKYIEVPIRQFHTFNLASITRLFDSTMPTINATVKVTTFGGEPAYELTEPDGGRAFIAKQGKHYLLEVRWAKQAVTFTEWNNVPAVTAPPASKIVNPSSLG